MAQYLEEVQWKERAATIYDGPPHFSLEEVVGVIKKLRNNKAAFPLTVLIFKLAIRSEN